MADFLSQYSIQRWLEMCPQGYLDGTVYGHEPGETESEDILNDESLREASIAVTVQLIAGERAALAASSGLVNCAPDYASKTFLATQTLYEARHVEIFTQRLMDLGVKKDDVNSTVADLANPHLVKFAEVLLEKVNDGDFVAGVVGQNIVLEGMAFSVFEMLQATSAGNPKFANTLAGTIADERRHVGFGENRIGSLIREHPEKKAEVEAMHDVNSVAARVLMDEPFGLMELGADEPAAGGGVSLHDVEPIADLDLVPDVLPMDAAVVEESVHRRAAREEQAVGRGAERGPRADVIATLERWLGNLERRRARRAQ